MIDISKSDKWEHLIIPFDDLSEKQQDEAFLHHTSTGGDMVFLKTGEVISSG